METEIYPSCKRNTRRLPKMFQYLFSVLESIGSTVSSKSFEFPMASVLPAIAISRLNKNTTINKDIHLCHIMNNTLLTEITSRIDRFLKSGKKIEEYSLIRTDLCKLPIGSSIVLSQKIHVNNLRQASLVEKMSVTPCLLHNSRLGDITIQCSRNKSGASVQINSNNAPKESESNNTEKKASATVTEKVSSTQSDKVEKKKKNRCAKCNKKLTISAQYTCRCGLTFCPKHRHSESHSCTYNYRKKGRDYIEKNNPRVVRPKIPKI